MRTLNVHEKVRELVPDGYTVGSRLVLAGAKIFDADGNYLGYWHEREMPKAIRRELLSELRANWTPGFITAGDW
jgi:hypothetical protein